jgi:hypothetical protein
MTVTVSKGSVTLTKTFVLQVSAPPDEFGYLFAYFIGNTSLANESIYFALSRDGLQWTSMNRQRVVSPTTGSQHIRDPFIIKGPAPDGTTKYYMIATDLSTQGGSYSNTALYTWESSDLITWSAETRLVLSGTSAPASYITRPSANTWAPEAIWIEDYQGDGFTGAYMMFWTANIGNSVGNGNYLVYSMTRDFKTLLTPPAYLYSNAAVNNRGSGQTMDGSIIKVNDKYYLFYREDGGNICRVEATSITGEKSDWSNRRQIITTAGSWEGPEAYQLIGSTGVQGWVILADHFGGTGASRYGAFRQGTTVTAGDVTANTAFNEITGGTGASQTNINLVHDSTGSVHSRHGAVIKIDESRFRALWLRYLGTEYPGN